MISHLLTYGNSIRSTQTVAFVNNMLKTGFSIPAHKLPFYAHTEQLITKSTYTRPICIISWFSGIFIPDQNYTPHISTCKHLFIHLCVYAYTLKIHFSIWICSTLILNIMKYISVQLKTVHRVFTKTSWVVKFTPYK